MRPCGRPWRRTKKKKKPKRRQPYPNHKTSLWQRHLCSPCQCQLRRLVPNNSWSGTGMFTPNHSLQHIFGKDHNRRLKKSQEHCQQWRHNNHESPLCWWHRWLGMRWSRSGKITWASRQSLHSLRHGDQCREDQADNKQHQWHQHRD